MPPPRALRSSRPRFACPGCPQLNVAGRDRLRAHPLGADPVGHAPARRTDGVVTPPVWYALGWLCALHGCRRRGRSYSFRAVRRHACRARRDPRSPCCPPVGGGARGSRGRPGRSTRGFMGAESSRAYELYALLAALYALVVLRFATRPSSWTAVALTIVVIAGSLTHYWFLLVVLASLVWLWLSDELRVVRARTTKVVALGMIPFALWSPVLAVQYHRGSGSRGLDHSISRLPPPPTGGCSWVEAHIKRRSAPTVDHVTNTTSG